jgi:hypothetical protein
MFLLVFRKCNAFCQQVFLDPGHNLRGREDADVLEVDPIHPIEPVYRSLVASIFQMAATLRQLGSRVENKRRREESHEDSLPHSRRPRI